MRSTVAGQRVFARHAANAIRAEFDPGFMSVLMSHDVSMS
jgi:hypothetical protein